METRKFISLDGEWEYTLDRDYQNAADWKKMFIPSNWYLQGLDRSGLVIFRKKFKSVKLKKYERIFLCFKGVDYTAEVIVNGINLGAHEGYFGPFKFNITNILKEKEENEIIVKVDSPFETAEFWPHKKRLIKGIFGQHDTRPGGWDIKKGQDKNSGGIWNSVSLMVTNVLRTRWITVQSKIISEKEAILLVTANIQKLADYETVKVEIVITPENFEDSEPIKVDRIVSLAREKDPIVFCLTVRDPKLWWPRDYGYPHLYKVSARIYLDDKLIDEFNQVFGIREIEIKDWVWYINNKRIFIRGVNFIPTQWLSEYSIEKINKDIDLLIGANVNAVRVHGHINRKELYQECDKAGMLVWQDFALQWSYTDDNEFISKSVIQIREMAHYLMNHPSIVVWCCHNEPSENKEKLTPILYTALKSADPWRHIEMSSDLETHPYPGWYYGHYKEFASLPCAPMITEFGAQALPCRESLEKFIDKDKLWPPDWDFWAYHNFRYEQTFNVAKIEMGGSLDEFIQNSQDYQARLLKYAIENYRRAKHNPTTGLFQFMFVDCWPSITWSIVDYYRNPKKSYDILKLAYQPVLITLAVKREPLIAVVNPGEHHKEMFAFWDPRQTVWITNDLYEKFENCLLVLKIEDKHGNVFGTKEIHTSVLPDSSKMIWSPKRFEKAIKLNKFLEPDIYILSMQLFDEKMRMISFNYEEIRLLNSGASI